MQTYIATVKILVAAPSPTDACDVISAALGDPINTALVDWGYIRQTPDTCTSGCPQGKCRCVFGGYIPTANGTGFAYPEPAPDIDLLTYVEGSFISPANSPYSDL